MDEGSIESRLYNRHSEIINFKLIGLGPTSLKVNYLFDIFLAIKY